MSQQINLLNPELRPKADLLTLNNLALLASLVLVVVMLAGAWGQQKLSAAREWVSTQERQLKEAQAQLGQLVAMQASRRPSAALEQQLAQTRQLLTDKQEVLRILESGVIGSAEGFSPFMEALARSVPEGLWLTGFDVLSGNQQLRIEGRMNAESLLPRFVQQMNLHPRLQGKGLSALQIQQHVPQPAASGQEAAAAPVAAKEEPPYWKFVLGTEFDKGGRP